MLCIIFASQGLRFGSPFWREPNRSHWLAKMALYVLYLFHVHIFFYRKHVQEGSRTMAKVILNEWSFISNKKIFKGNSENIQIIIYPSQLQVWAVVVWYRGYTYFHWH
jgi:hypothetical protein